MHLWAMVLLVYSITVGGSIQPMSSKFAADDPPYGPYMKILWLGSLGPPTRPAHDDHDVTPGCSRHNTMEWKTMTRCFTVIRIHTWTLVVRRLCFYKANPLENVFQQTGLESVFVGKHNKHSFRNDLDISTNGIYGCVCFLPLSDVEQRTNI